jgi:hypothetical protein
MYTRHSNAAYEGEFYSEVGIQNELGTRPLFFRRWHLIRLKLPLAKVWHGVNNNPGNATTKVDNLKK